MDFLLEGLLFVHLFKIYDYELTHLPKFPSHLPLGRLSFLMPLFSSLLSSLIFSPSTLSHLSSTPQSFFPVFPPFHLLPLVLSYFSTLLQMVKRVRMEYCKRGTESQQSRDAVEGVVRSFETRIGAERATVQTGSSIL